MTTVDVVGAMGGALSEKQPFAGYGFRARASRARSDEECVT